MSLELVSSGSETDRWVANKRGNLSTKSLVGVVNKEDVVVDSEYLETLFVAVPK